MSLHAKLQQRAQQRNPLRIGLIGAGKFGAMYLAQIPRTPGVHLVGIADLNPASARANLERDYPNRARKPVDAPFPPFADTFPLEQHRLGPFKPIQDAPAANPAPAN